MSQVVRYTSEFVQSNLLARRLAHFCAKKIAQMCTDSSPCNTTSGGATLALAAITDGTSAPSPAMAGSATGTPVAMNTTTSLFADYCNCLHHRSLLLSLTAVIQVCGTLYLEVM